MMDLLPNTCAPLAAAMCKILEEVGVPCRPLLVEYNHRNPKCSHVVTCFMSFGRLRVYDHNGTRDLPKGLKLTDAAIKIAKAWDKAAYADRDKVTASWYSPASRSQGT